MIVDIFLIFVKIWLFIYDVISFPIYWIIQRPYIKQSQIKKDSDYGWKKSDSYISLTKNVLKEKSQHQELIKKNNVDTLFKVWQNSVTVYGDKQCLGTRKVLGEEDEKQPNGKIFKKLSLGEYSWMKYKEADKIVSSFGSGLINLGLKSKDTVSIYAETRQEWLLCSLGAFRQNLMVSTLYTNLGDDAICHGIQETEVSTVITSHSLLPKLKAILIAGKCPKVQTVIFMEDELFKTDVEGFPENIKVLSFQSVLRLGEETPCESTPPSAEDTAIIMYTSGSTGVPKGVLLSHQNMVSTLTAIFYLREFTPADCYIAYLPLAHVLELTSELTSLLLGIPVGYSSPNTMTDMSSAIKKGDKGDVTLLQPTIINSVPLVLIRIQKNLIDAIGKNGPAFKKVFNLLYEYKLKWNKDGYTTPILSKLVFQKFNSLLGGKLKFMLVGSAPLSPETQEFLRTCLDIDMVQGYTMTEASCCGTVQAVGCTQLGVCGGPMYGMEVRLVDWEEGGYRITDKPNPRGELIMGGVCVSKGYFKNEEKTAEDFFIEDGKQYFKTGDIAELLPNGYIKIIDRKKDLVKLQAGEYVSLGKVESQLKTNALVDNICVYASSSKTHTVAILVPVKDQLEKFAAKIDKHYEAKSLEELCMDPALVEKVVKNLGDHGKQRGLEKFEIPTKLTLIPTIWTPEMGLVTAALKLKRKEIQKTYQEDIDRMYST